MYKFLFLAGLVLASTLKSFAGSEGDVTAGQLLALTNRGVVIPETENQFRMDDEKPKNVSLFSLTNVTFWTADMDIDSDGRETPICNTNRDPWHQDEISAGKDIAADETPYFVIPIGKPADYKKRGIAIGQVAAVIYRHQIAYAVFLDEDGEHDRIGEASIATANLLGVDSDPKTGGTDGPVTYIVFTGAGGRLDENDYTNHQLAIEIGVKRAKELIAQYAGTNSIAGIPNPPVK